MCLIGLLLGPAYGLISFLGGHSAPENSGMAYAAMAFGAPPVQRRSFVAEVRIRQKSAR